MAGSCSESETGEQALEPKPVVTIDFSKLTLAYNKPDRNMNIYIYAHIQPVPGSREEPFSPHQRAFVCAVCIGTSQRAAKETNLEL